MKRNLEQQTQFSLQNVLLTKNYIIYIGSCMSCHLINSFGKQ